MPLPGLSPGAGAPPDEHVWTLTKGRLTAVCWQRLHALGLELRLDVNRDTMRTTIVATRDEALAETTRMRQLMLDKGWVQPAEPADLRTLLSADRPDEA